MFVRVNIFKFSKAMHAEMLISMCKTKMIPLMKHKSKCLNMKLIDIGEGKIMNVATYANEEEFNDSNKWMKPIINEMVNTLGGKVESIPGNVLLTYEKLNYKD